MYMHMEKASGSDGFTHIYYKTSQKQCDLLGLTIHIINISYNCDLNLFTKLLANQSPFVKDHSL